MSECKAVVDLGTHSCLLLVGRRGPGGVLDVLEDRCEIARFGEGLAATGGIGEAGLARVEAALAGFLERALELGCERVVVGGTAALRRAANQAQVIARLEALPAQLGLGIGLAVEVIAEDREARLGWAGAAGGSPATCVLDVGGGSTEIVAAEGTLAASMPVGALVLTERWGSEDWAALLDAARRGVAGFAADGVPAGSSEAPWVALGGTATNLASLELALPVFDHLVVEGARLAASAAARWGQRLAGMSCAQRAGFPIEAARAEVLPAGLACVAATLELLGVEVLNVSGRGLRHGFLAELLSIR